MEFNAVYHQASDNYCYPLNEDELIINIKTGYDVKSVSIILGDPFAAGILGGGEHWDGKKEPIIYKKRLKNHKTEKLQAKSIPPETNSRHAGTTLRACSIRIRLSHRCGQLSIIS